MMLKNYPEEPLLPHLAVCITFFYKPERLAFLKRVISNYFNIANRIEIFIATNISDYQHITKELSELPNHVTIEFFTPSGMGHPYLLTWAHHEIFHKIFNASEASHFLYTEDDLLFSRSNVEYWLRYRDSLQEHGLIPSFFRVEFHHDKGWVSTDCWSPACLYKQPKLNLKDGSLFVCMPNCYQGIYFLDRPLMEEFFLSPARSPDFGKWNIREKASQGLTFVNIPKGYTSRNILLIDTHRKGVPQEAWIHHLPNNYAYDESTTQAKVPMSNLFISPVDDYLRRGSLKVKRILKSELRIAR